MELFKTAILDSGIPNSEDVLIEKETLKGAGNVVRYQVKSESDLPCMSAARCKSAFRS